MDIPVPIELIGLATISWQLIQYRDWIGATGVVAMYGAMYLDRWLVGRVLTETLKTLRDRLRTQGVSTEEIDGLLAK